VKDAVDASTKETARRTVRMSLRSLLNAKEIRNILLGISIRCSVPWLEHHQNYIIKPQKRCAFKRAKESHTTKSPLLGRTGKMSLRLAKLR